MSVTLYCFETICINRAERLPQVLQRDTILRTAWTGETGFNSAEIQFDQIVNVQGDEPLIDMGSVDRVIEVLETSGVDIATLACPLESDAELASRDVVKVVTALNGDALYFSRAPLAGAQRHVGLYGYQAAVLRRLASLPPSPLERAESLEQLRALQNGFKIRVVQTAKAHLGVDRPEDIPRVESELAKHR